MSSLLFSEPKEGVEYLEKWEFPQIGKMADSEAIEEGMRELAKWDREALSRKNGQIPNCVNDQNVRIL
jgi:hypothetical protein